MADSKQAHSSGPQSNGKIQVLNGLSLGHRLSVFEGFATQSASNDSELVRLHVGLRGDYRFAYRQLGQSFDLAGGHHNIMYSKGIHVEVTNKTLEIETFGIDFPKELFIEIAKEGDVWMERFVEDVVAGKNSLLSPTWGTVTIKIQQVIDEILHHSYSGYLGQVFLYAKALELFVLCVENYQEIRQRQSAPFITNTSDKEKLIAARDFLNDRLISPPNITEVAKYVGLNEFKLKRGFKELFQSTIFGYLTERRLHLARIQLLDSQKTAAEIAYEFGYSSPQHFHKQFKNKFGVTPNGMRKNP